MHCVLAAHVTWVLWAGGMRWGSTGWLVQALACLASGVDTCLADLRSACERTCFADQLGRGGVLAVRMERAVLSGGCRSFKELEVVGEHAPGRRWNTRNGKPWPPHVP